MYSIVKKMKTYLEGKITIYTPTFNRGYCLNRLYQSLLGQTNLNFEWLIIDDGSTDNTKELVGEWIAEKKIPIRYFYQNNSGKMQAVNVAHGLINTELNTCVDSDDYLLNDAVEIILTKWKEVREKKYIAGIVGLDVFRDGKIVGTAFPKNLSVAKFSEFDIKYNIKGDKKFIYRTEIIQKYPKYPSIAGEKFPAPGYLYRLIDQDYDLYLINEKLCVVEYLEDGISKNKFTQFKKCPNAFAFYRLERMRLAINYRDKFVNAAHYISSCLFSNKNMFKDNPFWLTTFFALPVGLLLNVYIKMGNKKGAV